jgi:hypothetical protein
MNKIVTIIALLALAMLVIVPASAVWHNGHWYTDEDYKELVGDAKVVHNPKTGVDSKYKDTNPAKSPEVFAGANTCILEGNVRAGYNTLTKKVELRNAMQQDNETGIIIPILPDGTFRYDGLAQGEYVLRITPEFEGLGPAQESRVVCTSGVARPMSELLGYAITVDAAPVCQREILHAEYGAFEQVCEDVTYTSKYPKCGYHLEYRYRVGEYSHHRCDYSHSEWSEWADVFEQTRATPRCIQVETRWAKHTQVCDQVGGYTTVTGNVRDVVAAGHLSFLFDNRPTNGGIFATDGTTLLSEIGDPVPGVVKHVSITYKDCSGMEQSVSAEEYQQITLL